MKLATIVLIISSASASIFNSNNRLFQVWDSLMIYNSSDLSQETLVNAVNMTTFPYIAAYESNISVSGYLCYSPNITFFNSTCYDQQPDQTWIMINPFQQESSNEIIDKVKPLDFNYNVVGLIFVTSSMISTNQTYAQPPIISEVSYDHATLFEDYSYNINSEIYTVNYTHHFIQNCWVLDPIVPSYYAFGLIWGLIVIVFTVALYSMPASERFSLQKSLIILPSLKCAEVLLEGGFLQLCPWYSISSNGIQYTQMARISIITITYTVILSFFYLLCKGWQTTVASLTRQQATNLTMILGGVYLTYSAYFLSFDFNTIYLVMNFVMVAVYLGLGIQFNRNCRENMNLCKNYLNEIVNDGDQVNVMRECLALKFKILKWIMAGAAGFCVSKMLLYGGVNSIKDQFITVKLELIIQSFDFIWIGMILFICRPRKAWPAYFTLPVNDLRQANGRGGDADDNVNQPPPLLVGNISQKFLNDQYDYDRTNSIGSDDAVIFVNPTKYSQEHQDDNYERSAFEDSTIDQSQFRPHRVNDSQNLDEAELDVEGVQKVLQVGFKDKRQLKRQKKGPNPQTTSLLSRFFGRSNDVAEEISDDDQEANN